MRYAISGLDYVYLENVPVRRTSHGDVLAVDVGLVERAIAREIVLQGVPIRGAEVQFLRKSLALSMAGFGKLLGLSAPAILKWERARSKRLQPANEVAVRALIAEQLDISVEGKFTVLRGKIETPERMLLHVGKRDSHRNSQSGGAPGGLEERRHELHELKCPR